MVTKVTGVNERMKEPEKSPVLEETWHLAETIDEKGTYQKLKYREIEQISFYVRPAREWFIPCPECQKKLKKLLAEARWILGNKNYEPPVELNSVKDEIDDDSWTTLEEHKATPVELERIGKEGWERIE
jgi:hypothetical protein